MKAGLRLPRVVGQINPELFDIVQTDTYYSDGDIEINRLPQGVKPLFSEMAFQLGFETDRYARAIVRKRLVQPGEVPSPVQIGEWHTDLDRSYLTASASPTEFLAGSIRSIRDMLRVPRSTQIPLGNAYYVNKIATIANRHTDDELRDRFGFNIWAPASGEIVEAQEIHLHRAATNKEVRPVQRVLGILVT